MWLLYPFDYPSSATLQLFNLYTRKICPGEAEHPLHDQLLQECYLRCFLQSDQGVDSGQGPHTQGDHGHHQVGEATSSQFEGS